MHGKFGQWRNVTDLVAPREIKLCWSKVRLASVEMSLVRKGS